ncbi:sugar ABC transporter substrate-binding protein, partial [Streptomyces sp. PRB2-1]|nr:sugar ABC transporter substrate-binding protein [Actinacidiphila epipremni]
PVQKDSARYKTSAKIVSCLTSDTNLLATDTTLSYVAPTLTAQHQQLAGAPELDPWVDAVGDARGRTSGGLGTRYPVISEQLWTAVQGALSGGKSPQSALQDAQKAVDNHQG